jgi:hypothetical protein
LEDVITVTISGFEVALSACDLERVQAKKWHKDGGVKRGGPYFSYSTPRPEHKKVRLHRFLLNCPPKMIVDHVYIPAKKIHLSMEIDPRVHEDRSRSPKVRSTP